MPSRGLDELFDRYRRTRDPSALAELFDRTAPRLLRVARHLASDRGAAEDILQATFLAVIESAHRFDPARPVMPWLMGILTNQIRLLRRESRQVLDRDRLRREAVVDPIAAAESAELHHATRRAIGQLPPSCRSPLRLVLQHGLSAREIAGILGRASGTVRSQVARGLARLRRLLPRGFVAPALGLPCGPDLAAVRAHVLQRAIAGAGALPARSFLTGALLMKKTLALVATLVLGLAVWFVATQSASRPETAALAAGTAGPIHSASDPTAEPPASTQGATTARTRTPAADLTQGELRVCVQWHDGTPAAEIGVEVLPLDQPDAALHARLARTAADGAAAFAGVRPGRVQIVGDRGGAVEVEVTGGQRSLATLTIPAGLDLCGRVTTVAGEPIGAASIWVSGRNLRAGISVAACSDRDGRFQVRSVASGRFVAATAAGFAPGKGQEVRGEPGRTRHLTLVLNPPGGALAGRVTDPGGQPIAGAFVVVGECVGMGHFDTGVGSTYTYPTGHWLRTDAAGCFRAEGVTVGKPVLVRARAVGFAGWQGTARVPAGGDESIPIMLVRGSTVTGRVVDDSGRAVAGARVHAWSPNAQYSAAWADTEVLAGATGQFVLAGLGSGRLSLDVTSPDGLRAHQELPVGEGQTVTWNPVLVRGLELRGRVLTEAGAPVPRIRVQATATPRGPDNGGERLHRVESVTDDAGCFVLKQCETRTYDVGLWEEGTWYSNYRIPSLEPGGAEHTLVFPEVRRPTCSIRGQLLGPDGLPVEDARIYLSPDPDPQGWSAHLRVDPDSGAFVTPRFPPGSYRLSASVPGHPTVHRIHTLAPGQLLDVGTIRVQHPATLVVSLAVTGAVTQGIEYQLRSKSRGWAGEGKVEGSPLRLECLAPDRYLVSLWGGQAPLTHVYVELAEGEEKSVSVALPAAVACRLRLRVDGRQDLGSILLLWRAAAGEVLWSESVSLAGHRTLELERLLPAGTWRVEARVFEQTRAERTFALSAELATEPIELVVR